MKNSFFLTKTILMALADCLPNFKTFNAFECFLTCFMPHRLRISESGQFDDFASVNIIHLMTKKFSTRITNKQSDWTYSLPLFTTPLGGLEKERSECVHLAIQLLFCLTKKKVSRSSNSEKIKRKLTWS